MSATTRSSCGGEHMCTRVVPRCAEGRELSEPHPSCQWPNHSSRKHRAQHSLLWETILQLRLTNAAPPSEAPMRPSGQGGLCAELRGEAQLEIAVFRKNNIHVQIKYENIDLCGSMWTFSTRVGKFLRVCLCMLCISSSNCN